MNTTMTTTVALRDVTVRFGDYTAVEGVSFEVPAGTFSCRSSGRAGAGNPRC